MTGSRAANLTLAGLSVVILGAAVLLSGCATTMDRSELASEYYNLGTAFFDLGDLERSADYFIRALELDENLARASYNLARVHVLQGRYADADQLLRSLLTEDPNNTIVLETLGYVAYSRGDLDAAAATYDEVLRIDPANLNVLYNQAIISDETGDLERAAALLNDARAVSESDPEVLELLASVHERLGNTAEAISALELLKRVAEPGWEPLLNLAELYRQVEQYDRALEELESIVETVDDIQAQSEAQFRKSAILLTAAQEPEAGLEALVIALEAGFSDAERAWELQADPAIVAPGEVRDILDTYLPMPAPSESGEPPDPTPPPEEGTDKTAGPEPGDSAADQSGQ